MVEQLLENAKHHVKIRGIEILSQKGHHHGFKILLKHLEKKYPLHLKIKIIRALAKIGDPKAIAALLVYRRHPNLQLRRAVVEALDVLQYNKPKG